VTGLVLHDVEVGGRTGVDVRVEDDVVVAIGAAGDVATTGAEVVDGRGGALLPGLHDHHLHLLALAARMGSVDLDTAPGAAAADVLLTGAAAVGDVTSWLRVGGYDEHRHGPLDRQRLDGLVGARPVRVQHRSGLSWVVATAGLERLGLGVTSDGEGSITDPTPPGGGEGVERDASGTATGWLHRLDGWVRDRVGPEAPDLAPVGARLAAAGVTGVTDTTPALVDGSLGLLVEARRSGALPQRLMVLGRDDDGGFEGWASLGPAKLVVDEHADTDIAALAARVRAARTTGLGERRVALHCVTRVECIVAVAALDLAGALPGDRLEHASVLPDELDADLAAAGVVVVTQPAFVYERGDHYLFAVDEADREILYRQASLLAHGVGLAFSSDAPVAAPDPWLGIATASTRRTRGGTALGSAEALAPQDALDRYLSRLDRPGGSARRVVAGAPADLCLLHVPLAEALRSPTAANVRATVMAGRFSGEAA
jgi:predicted amidohydrolase YtcJ